MNTGQLNRSHNAVKDKEVLSNIAVDEKILSNNGVNELNGFIYK